MSCPLCGSRPARRRCPALNQQICTVCCGTKRETEIRCPSDCGYLTASRRHPPAAVQRQREQDTALLWPALSTLTQRQSDFFFLFAGLAARHPVDPLAPLQDADLAEAANSLGTTVDTASRGLIYDARPQSLAAQRLESEMKQALGRILDAHDGPRTPLEKDAAAALRALEEAARRIGPLAGDPTAGALAVLRRLFGTAQGEGEAPAGSGAASPGGLIIP
ncbi:MAG TPA: hypothetical protein VF198_08760 [Vicinamibacterales bacterium]